jgi:hypothetical protein
MIGDTRPISLKVVGEGISNAQYDRVIVVWLSQRYRQLDPPARIQFVIETTTTRARSPDFSEIRCGRKVCNIEHSANERDL